MKRLALLALLLVLASFPLPPAQARSVSMTYAIGAAEVSRSCSTFGMGLGGACMELPESNINDFDIRLLDGTGWSVGAYYSVTLGNSTLQSGFFCSVQHVHTNYANQLTVKVFPSITNSFNSCGMPATGGEVRVSW